MRWEYGGFPSAFKIQAYPKTQLELMGDVLGLLPDVLTLMDDIRYRLVICWEESAVHCRTYPPSS